MFSKKYLKNMKIVGTVFFCINLIMVVSFIILTISKVKITSTSDIAFGEITNIDNSEITVKYYIEGVEKTKIFDGLSDIYDVGDKITIYITKDGKVYSETFGQIGFLILGIMILTFTLVAFGIIISAKVILSQRLKFMRQGRKIYARIIKIEENNKLVNTSQNYLSYKFTLLYEDFMTAENKEFTCECSFLKKEKIPQIGEQLAVYLINQDTNQYFVDVDDVKKEII